MRADAALRRPGARRSALNILHIETGRHVYGGARQVLHLMDGLRAAGVTGALACVPDSEVAMAARAAGHEVHTPRFGGDLDVLALPRLRRLIRTLNPDLVHVHSRRGAPLYGLLAAGGAGVPAVLSRRVDNPPSALDRWLLNGPHCARVICISDAIADVLAGAGVRRDRLRRVASAVAPAKPVADAAARLCARFDLPAGACVLGVAAQLIPRKGQADLISALPAIRARHPQVVVVLFGQGPEAASLRAQVARLGLDEHVRFAGFVDDLAPLLGGLDVLVHPARAEGLGVVLLEAAAAGVVRVACDAGGIPQTVRHESTGLLVPPADPDALSAAVCRVLEDDALRQRLIEGAHRQVEAEHSIDAMTAGNLAVYREVL